MTVQCKALGKRSKLGQHTKSFPREWSEFQNWCDYMEVPHLAVELWELQKGGEELRAAYAFRPRGHRVWVRPVLTG